MSNRFQKEGNRQRHFIREWRAYRGLTQELLADRLGISKASLSRIETGRQPYTQDMLEALAEALMCDPADLIMRDPTTQDAMWSLWESASPAEKAQITSVVRALVSTTKKAS
ncbi:MAG TPA: helix-turn-helix transcriptional regulator [Devosia sp.]|nr:helix-turn-helix transcriptional regulator [Devosia sp.]